MEEHKSIKIVDSSIPKDNELFNKWDFYYHSHTENNSQKENWTLETYFKIATFETVDEVIIAMNELTTDLLTSSMFFVMKNGISPRYEDNKLGGYFTFKLMNNEVLNVFKNVCYALCGESILSNTISVSNKKLYLQNIIGIGISPKKGFCILKIWLNTRSLINAHIINVPLLKMKGALFVTK